MLAAGTSDGIVTIERQDGSWSVGGRALEGVRVEALARAGGVIIAATDQGVYESSDDGATWRATLENVDMRSLAVAIDGAVFAGADNAVLYRRRPADEQFTEVLSFKDLPTFWSWTFPVAPHYPNLRAIAVSPTDPNRVYVGVEVGGVMASDDGGESWREAREGMHPDIHGLAVAPGDSDHVFAVTGVGFFRTTDGAQSWQSSCDGFENLYTIAIANDPADPQRLYASATAGRPRNWRDRPEGAVAKVYQSVDGGAAWGALMAEGLVEAVDALAVDNNGAVFAGSHGGQVLARTPDGEGWSVVADGLPPVNCILA